MPATIPGNRSLSHSHGYAALALADPTVRIGIDIEAVIPRDFLAMAALAFDPAEARLLATLDRALLAGRFYEFWTLKEAFAKALELSLADALTLCRCVDEAGNVFPSIPTAQPWRATVFAPRPDLRLAIACVADSARRLQGGIRTEEWPAPARTGWPVVLDLLGEEGTCATAPYAATCADP